MKNTKHVILTSLMGLLVSTAYTMDENAVVGNAPAGQHLMGQMQNPQMTSWEGITHLMGVDMARASTLVVNKVDAELAGPTGVSLEGINHLMGVDMPRANALLAARAAAEIH